MQHLILRILLLLVLTTSLMASADIYYVRPYSAQTNPYLYGSATGNGVSYATAWNGLGNVRWKDTHDYGVGAGDTLFVCGMHPDVTVSPKNNGIINGHTKLDVKSSGTQQNPIIIRFDCSTQGLSPPNDSGTILRVARQYLFDAANPGSTGWVNEGGGVYSVCAFGATATYIEYDYSAGHPGVFNRLEYPSGPPGSVPLEWVTHGRALHTSMVPVGSNCSNSIFYYKPSAGVTKTAVYVTSNDNAILIDGRNYVNIVGRPDLDPALSVAGRENNLLAGGVLTKSSSYLKMDHLFIKYTGLGGITPNDRFGTANCTDIEISNSRIEWSRYGIYNTSDGDSNSCTNFKIHHNYISHINQEKYWGYADRHGIQIEAGSSHLIEHNTIEHVGSHGIGFDGKSAAQMNNNVVRYNFISDIGPFDLGFNETAFHLEGTPNNYVPDNQRNNRVHNNIFTGSVTAGVYISTAGKPTSGYSWAFYNNVVHNNKNGYLFHDSFDADPNNGDWNVGFKLKNNIVVNPSSQHVEHIYNAGRTDRTGIDVDYNLYNPAAPGALLFDWRNVLRDFDYWRNIIVNNNCGGTCPTALDEHSQAVDPLFLNASGSLSVDSDFQLSALSPAIDAGTANIAVDTLGQPVTPGLDYVGNPIYGAPDLGVYEYQPPYMMEDDSIPGYPATGHRIAENVRVYGNGRYRNLPPTGQPVDYQADLEIFPQTAWGTTNFSAADFKHWMDVRISNWSNDQKVWTVTRQPGTITSNDRFFIRGVQTGQQYYICIDDNYWSTVTAYGGNEATFAVGHPQGITRKYEMVPASGGGSATCSP